MLLYKKNFFLDKKIAEPNIKNAENTSRVDKSKIDESSIPKNDMSTNQRQV